MNSRAIVVVLAKDNVRTALSVALARDFPRQPISELAERAAPGDIVISSPGDCGLSTCRSLLARGCSVVILAPLPVEAQLHAYQRLGAKYVAMDLDRTPLVTAVSALLAGEDLTISVVEAWRNGPGGA